MRTRRDQGLPDYPDPPRSWSRRNVRNQSGLALGDLLGLGLNPDRLNLVLASSLRLGGP